MESNLLNAYQIAYTHACDRLADRDPGELCLRTGAICLPGTEGRISLKYLGSEYVIDLRGGGVSLDGSEAPVSTAVKLLLLHYLLHAKGAPLSGRLISFKEIPGGVAVYYPAFYKRAVRPLVETFGNNIESFYRAAEKFSATREKYGHAAVTLNVLPRVPVTYVIWRGDEEFPTSGTILFDETVASFLPGEAIALAASFGVYALTEREKKERKLG